MSAGNMLLVYQSLAPGDRVEVTHAVKVGFQHWTSITTGVLVSKTRERHSLHFRRNRDDRVYRDVLVLRRDDCELTTVTLDEFTDVKLLHQTGAGEST